MNKIVVGSISASSGKTSVILGLMKNHKKKAGYMKPFGDRLYYKKKRLCDHDSIVVNNSMKLDANPSDLSIGFDHSKLKFMYDEDTIKKKLETLLNSVGKGKDIVFIESGKTITYGSSLSVDALSLAETLQARLILVVSGNDSEVLDEIAFIKNHMLFERIEFAGIIINKIIDLPEFMDTYLPEIKETGIPILGMIPYEKDLTHPSVEFLSNYLMAKVVAGEAGLGNIVKHIMVGAMSADAVLRKPIMKQDNKLVITAGDRSDMVLAAIEASAIGIVLTNGILPPANILSIASQHRVPLLLVEKDTYSITKSLDRMDSLLCMEDEKKTSLIASLVKKHVNIKNLF